MPEKVDSKKKDGLKKWTKAQMPVQKKPVEIQDQLRRAERI